MNKSALAASLIVFLFISAPPIFAQEEAAPEEFTELHDLIPDKCFSAPLSIVGPGTVDIGIESGYSSTTWQSKASSVPRVTAPPGSATISVTDAVISVEYEPQVVVP